MGPFFIISIILLQSSLVLTQSLPDNIFSYKSRKLLYDAGIDWETLSVFGPIRFKSIPQKKQKKSSLTSYFDGKLGIRTGNISYGIYGYGYFKYNYHYYGYLYPTLLKKAKKEYDIRINSMNYKDNRSGIGFENDWVFLQVGRDRESWGSGNDIELALSENSGTYDYFLLGSDYGKIRVRYIYGFLEQVENEINRYITARGFEWTNKRSLIIGLSESVIYSGENRSIDLGYLNPISSHLEIELNNRLNTIGDTSSNAVWQVHLDYLIKNNFRVSLNYLYDEFVFDREIEIGKEHGRAYSIRFAYTPVFSNNHLITLFSSFIYVGTPTFRHGTGTNNFVQSGRPLGWYGGSDSQEICIGMKYFNNKNLIINILSGLLISGEESITQRIFEPYADYLKGSFPSGEIEEKKYIETKITYWWGENYSITSLLHLSQNFNMIDLKLNIPIFEQSKM